MVHQEIIKFQQSTPEIWKGIIIRLQKGTTEMKKNTTRLQEGIERDDR